jgi:hypothetical protein
MATAEMGASLEALGPDGPAGASGRDGLMHVSRVLGGVFRAHRYPILLTYALFGLENALATMQPFVLGLAIDGLIGASFRGLGLFAATQLGHLAIGVMRRAYDTRMYGRIHAELVTRLVLEQRRRDVEVSRVAARSALSREFADFFERQIPVAIQMTFLIAGGLSILAVYDQSLMLLCLVLIVPATLLNTSYAKRTLRLSTHLHDLLEREVEVIHRSDAAEIREHYLAVARWRVRLSDSEAFNFGTMEIFVTALMTASLVRACGAASATPGEIMAVLRYVLMFVVGVDGLPLLIQQISRLRDVSRRCALLGEGEMPLS